MAAVTHALRDPWFVSFLPLITADLVATEYKGDWTLAAQQRMQRLDWLTSVEEVWSTFNSLPRINLLGVGSTFILSRNDKEPSFEAFPDGSRVVVNFLKSSAAEKGLEVILAAVMGETITEAIARDVEAERVFSNASGESGEDSERSCQPAPVCDVIRLAARPSREYADLVRIEVWLNDANFSSHVVRFLKGAFKDCNIVNGSYNIMENPFEAASGGKKPITPASQTMTKPAAD